MKEDERNQRKSNNALKRKTKRKKRNWKERREKRINEWIKTKMRKKVCVKKG